MKSTHKCSKCGEEKPASKFQHFKGRPSGQCRECKTAAMKAKRLREGVSVRSFSRVEDGKKLCMHCGAMKPLDEFSPSERGLLGLAAYCKPCTADKYRDRDRARSATAKYRKLNRERHLANHRVRMFEYRTRKKVTDDGSVTDEFLKALYATEHCYYCRQFVEPDQRTADHRVALNVGGAHSATNLVMACWACNSSKRDLSEEEFLNKGTSNDHCSKSDCGLDLQRWKETDDPPTHLPQIYS